jgi:hypothetical protein
MPGLVAAYKAGHVALFRSKLVGKRIEWFVPVISHQKPDGQLAIPTQEQTKAAIDYFYAPVLSYRAQKPAAAPATSRPR